MAVQMARHIWPEGTVLSAPASVLDTALSDVIERMTPTDTCDVASDFVWDLMDHASAFKARAAKAITSGAAMDTKTVAADIKVLKVIKSAPHMRFHHALGGVPKNLSCIHVVELQQIKSELGPYTAVDCMRKPFALDVRVLLQSGVDVLERIDVWQSPKAVSRTLPAFMRKVGIPAVPLPVKAATESVAPGAVLACVTGASACGVDALNQFVERRAFGSTGTYLAAKDLGGGADRRREIDVLVERGLLVHRAPDEQTVFEDLFALRDDAYIWMVVFTSASAQRAITFNIGDENKSQLKTASKLALALHLVNTDWTPQDGLTRANSYTHGRKKTFGVAPKLSSPRSYFQTLADSPRIFDVFGKKFQIHHKMPDAYYIGLIACRTKKQASDFKLFLETANLKELNDHDFREMLAEIDVLGDQETGETTDPTVKAIEDMKGNDGYTLHTDREREFARQVIQSLPMPASSTRTRPPLEMQLWTIYFMKEGDECAEDEQTLIKIYFDGASHQSKRPRIWVGCQNPKHHRCYKYYFLHHFPTLKDATVQAAAWVMFGLDSSLLKHGPCGHLQLALGTAELDAVEPYLPEDLPTDEEVWEFFADKDDA